MHKLQETLSAAEKKGRKGDALLGHLTPGDVIIPAGSLTADLRALLAPHFNLERYTAGHETNRKNPHTDLPEFFSEDGGFGTGTEGFGGGGFDGGFGGGGFDSGFDAGDYSAGTTGVGNFGGSHAAPDSGAVTQGFDPNGTGGYNSGSIGGWIDDAVNAVGSFFSDPGPNGFDATGGMDIGGGTDQGPPPENVNPLFPPKANVGAFPGLPAPFAPDVPDNLPDIGRYYSLLRGGVNDLSQRSLADNMMSPFMQGNKNVYGR